MSIPRSEHPDHLRSETELQRIAQIRMLACLAGSMLAVLTTGIVIYMQLTSAKAMIDSVNPRVVMAGKLENALSAMQSAESAQRGFLLTGNKTYVEAFNLDVHRVNEQMTALWNLANKEASHRSFLMNVTSTMRDKLAEMQLTIKLYQTKGLPVALNVVNNDSGRQFMNSMQTKFEAERAREAAENAESSRQLQSVSQNIAYTFAALVILALALSAAFALFVRRYVIATSRLQHNLIERSHLREEQSELLELTYDAVMVRDLEDGTIRFWNRGAQELYGYSKEEAIGRKSHELLKTEFPTALEEIEKEAPAIGHWEGELIQTTKDNRKLTVDSRWRFKADKNGRLSSILETDITERKLAEATILRNNEVRLLELERSNEELQQFAYVCSHDLQEPLRVVSNFSQLLKNRYKGKLDDKADQFIEFIIDGSQRMHKLINDLLVLSRVQTQGQVATEVSCVKAVDMALKNLLLAIKDTDATINCGDLPIVEGDASQLMQLFQNLLGNAIKFKSLAPPKINISADRDGPNWQFAVSDNGVGLDMRYADRIFVIFQRLHTSQSHEGSGLGLAVCKKIVQRHGGRIWVESQPGKGSTFYFTMPALTEGASTCKAN